MICKQHSRHNPIIGHETVILWSASRTQGKKRCDSFEIRAITAQNRFKFNGLSSLVYLNDRHSLVKSSIIVSHSHYLHTWVMANRWSVRNIGTCRQSPSSCCAFRKPQQWIERICAQCVHLHNYSMSTYRVALFRLPRTNCTDRSVKCAYSRSAAVCTVQPFIWSDHVGWQLCRFIQLECT